MPSIDGGVREQTAIGVRVVSAAYRARCCVMSDDDGHILRVRPAFLIWTLGGLGWLVIMVVIARITHLTNSRLADERRELAAAR